MDMKMFAGFRFKPSAVIRGLNDYNHKGTLRIGREETVDGEKVLNWFIFTQREPVPFGNHGKIYINIDPGEVVDPAIEWLHDLGISYVHGMKPLSVYDLLVCYKQDCGDCDECAKQVKAQDQKDIFSEENLDMVPVARVREALGISEDSDIFEAIRHLKKSDERAHSEMYKARGEKCELQKQVREILGINREADFFEALRYAKRDLDEAREEKAQRRKLGKRLADIRKAAGMDDWDPTDLVEYVKRLREEKYKACKDYLDQHIDYLNIKEEYEYVKGLVDTYRQRNEEIKHEVLKVYSEIFDCSNGDPEGTYEEILHDILSEYKRALELKDAAEEKAIKYKEIATENRVQWNNTKCQLRWAQKENLEWVKRYEKLKSERDHYKWLYENLKNGVASVLQEAEEKEN